MPQRTSASYYFRSKRPLANFFFVEPTSLVFAVLLSAYLTSLVLVVLLSAYGEATTDVAPETDTTDAAAPPGDDATMRIVRRTPISTIAAPRQHIAAAEGGDGEQQTRRRIAAPAEDTPSQPILPRRGEDG